MLDNAVDKFRPGFVLIGPGGKHMTFVRHGLTDIRAKISDETRNTLYKPYFDVMILSAVDAFGGSLLGLIMTGMGKDGLEGGKMIKKRGRVHDVAGRGFLRRVRYAESHCR